MSCDPARAIHRILDASANRAVEGLRTLEEYARFALEDRSLAEPLKELRHELATAMAILPREALLLARNTAGDIGTQLQASDEYRRQGIDDVVLAATARVQQSLRCLEEYGKVISVDFAKRVEAVRYRIYDICAKLELSLGEARSLRQRLQQSTLYVLSDGAASESAFRERLRQCVDGGVDVFQLRDRRLSDRELLGRASQARGVLDGSEMLLIVNDRTDIAVAAGADGVHVGQDELPVDAVRKQTGPRMLIGVSTHDLDQARQAVRDGADYIGVGPCFPSQTKSFDRFIEPARLSEIAEEISIPAFAIGGITAKQIEVLRRTGLGRVAVSAAVCSAGDVRAAARELKTLLA